MILKGLVILSGKNRSKNIIIILIIFTICGAGMAIFAKQDVFEFTKEKIEAGKLYIYHSFPDNKFYYYIKSVDERNIILEAIAERAARKIFERIVINNDNMMLKSHLWQNLRDKEEMAIDTTWRFTIETAFSNNERLIRSTNKTEEGMENHRSIGVFKKIPTFFNNTNYVDLWMAMRFYPENKKKIEVGNVVNGYYTELIIEYQGQEEIEIPYGIVNCNKYEIRGKGLIAYFLGGKAWLWMSIEEDEPYMVKYINSNKPVLDMRLSEIVELNVAEWEEILELLNVEYYLSQN